MDYRIISSDPSIGQIVVAYSQNGTDIAAYAIDVPIVDGAYVTGAALEYEIQCRAPLWLAERKQLVASAANFHEVISGAASAPPTPEETLEEAKLRRKAEVATWRYNLETQGINFNGAPVRTDRESQAQLTSAYASLSNNLISSVDWKTADGTFVTLGLAEVGAIAQAVAQHVQNSFTQEKQYVEQINACQTVEALAAVTLPMTGYAIPTVVL